MAALLPLIACAIQIAFWPVIQPFAWLLFFPVPILATWSAGFYGGLISTVTSAVLVWYVFIPPQFSFAIDNPAAIYSIVIFIAYGTLISFFFGQLQNRLHQTDATLRASEMTYETLFNSMLDGFALCRMTYDDGKPSDFIFLNVNAAFGSLTGCKNVIGRRATDVIPGFAHTDPDLLARFGQTARTGQRQRFETFVNGLNMWMAISTYSPMPEHFVIIFDVISERKEAEQKEQQRRLAVETTLAEERERQSIASDLHDSLGQTLHVLHWKLEALAKSQSDSPEISKLVNDLNDMLVDSSCTVDSLISRLSPPALKELGLLAALSWLADEMRRIYGLVVTIDDDGTPKPLSFAKSAIIYRVVRELLINVSKHACVDTAHIELTTQDKRLFISVNDLGVGITDWRAKLFERQRFGLVSVNERIKILNGAMDIESHPGSGTSVKLMMPFDPSANEPQ